MNKHANGEYILPFLLGFLYRRCVIDGSIRLTNLNIVMRMVIETNH